MADLTAAVVLPAHNAEGTIARAVRSAWEQEPRPQEVVVGDDGSTDGTAREAERAGARVLRLPKANANVARNAAARATRADVLFFLDADDWFAPGKVAAHLSVHGQRRPSIVFDPAARVTPEGKRLGLSGPALGGPIGWRQVCGRTYWYGGSTASVRRETFEAVGGFREELSSQQDLDFWIRVLHRCGEGWVLPSQHTFWLCHPGSLSHNPHGVLENLERLLRGLEFLPRSDAARLRSHVLFNAADNLPLGSALPLLARALDRAYDPRFAKALFRSLRRTFR
ncbi:MAG: glycosyltransferase family 2 protein [Fimbriimonadales bacterium]|nr:glycosyltransferase family 2 protein [Fimbriimonadales bacterium]